MLRPTAAAVLLAASTLPALAQNAGVTQLALASALPGVVVTATRTPVQADRSVAEVTVIDREELDRASGLTLTQLLAQQPGVQYTANGGLGKNSSIHLRGLEFRHTLLLVDGVRYGSATNGTPNLDNLPLGDIERIEIVRGPLSSLYGSDAVGGVVQVFTRRATEGQRPNVAVTAGSHGYLQGGFGLSFADGPWDGSVQLQHTETRGFSATNVRSGNYNPDNDSFRQNAGNLSLGLKLSRDWEARVNLLESNGITDVDDGPGVDAKVAVQTRVAGFQVGGKVQGSWRTLIRVAHSTDVYDVLSTASAFQPLGAISTDQQQLSWENTVATPAGTLLLLGEHLKQNVSKPTTQYEVAERTVNSMAIGLNGQAGAHTWQASLRQDHNSQYDTQRTGSLGYGLQLAQGWRLTAAAGTSFVAPSFNDLYWPSFSNPLLQPEEGRHAELGLRHSAGAAQTSLSVFGNRIRGYITQGANPVNLPYATSHGASLSYENRIGALRVNTALEHVNPRNDEQGNTNYGKLLPRRAENSAKLGADWERGAWIFGSDLQAYSHRFDNPTNTIRLAGFATLDLRTQWQFQPDWALQFRVNNLADKPRETAYGYHQPGRELYLTLRYTPR
ncbi:MAG: hypothetical protein RJA44_2579 [Pseudomonadota bacterium]